MSTVMNLSESLEPVAVDSSSRLILDLARMMISLSGHVPDGDIPIVITGLRPGEKLDEQLMTDEEAARSREVHGLGERTRTLTRAGSSEARPAPRQDGQLARVEGERREFFAGHDRRHVSDRVRSTVRSGECGRVMLEMVRE